MKFIQSVAKIILYTLFTEYNTCSEHNNLQYFYRIVKEKIYISVLNITGYESDWRL